TGGANRALAQKALLHAVQSLVVRRDQVRIRRNTQARGIGTAGFKPFDFLKERLKVNHDAIAYNRHGVLGSNASGQQLELILVASDGHGVASVVTAIGVDHIFRAAAQDLCSFALAIVAPLRADDNDSCHGSSLPRFKAKYALTLPL